MATYKRISTNRETEAERAMIAQTLEDAKKMSIKPGSPEMELYLAAGYPQVQTRAHALELLAERKKNPAAVPWEIMKQCEAFLEALDARPTVEDIYHPPTDRYGNVISE